MAEVLGDILEFVSKLMKRLIGGIFDFAVEAVFERILHVIFWLYDWQHRLIGRILPVRWIVTPLALITFALTIATPPILLSALLRFAHTG